MGYVNNNKYLEMAKLDYNHCQAIHQLEWSHIQKFVITVLFIIFSYKMSKVILKIRKMQCIPYCFLTFQIINRWYEHLNIEESLHKRLLWSYYEAAASIFEPEKCSERVAWAKTSILLNTITSLFTRPHFSNVDIQAFLDEFNNPERNQEDRKSWHTVIDAMHETINKITSEAYAAHGVDIRSHLHCAVSFSSKCQSFFF